MSSWTSLRWKLGAVLALVCVALSWQVLRSPGWEASAEATRLGGLPAELFFIDVPHLARRGADRLVLVRIDGPVEMVPHHFRTSGLAAPAAIDVWADRLHAPLVFNAGQFDDAGEHLGWLKARGVWLRERFHPSFKGLLVGAPLRPVTANALGLGATIIDAAAADAAAAKDYASVVQSMMLLDAEQKLRVRRSDQAACRTVVAQDRHGRLLVIASEGAVNLADMAQWLSRSGLGIERAMNLDGGLESQLAITTPELQLRLFGQYGAEGTALGPHQAIMGRTPLPAVVAIYPQGQGPAR